MIELIETKLIELTKQCLTNSASQPAYRAVDAVPGDLRNPDTIKEMVKVAPSVYWAFLGGRGGLNTYDMAVIDGVWVAFMIVQHAGSYKARLHGDKTTIGLYEMACKVLPNVHGYTIDDVGTLKFRNLENLFNLNMDKTGVHVYAATFGLQMAFEPEAVVLDNFVTFHTESTLAADAPKIIGEETLPQ